MLTADLVHTRRKGGELFVVPLGARREAAVELARTIADVIQAHVGRTREELDAALDAIVVEPRETKLKDGLVKLIEDGLEFEMGTELDPVALRGEVFARATEARRALPDGLRLDRATVLTEVASAHAMDAESLERAIYADLKAAHVVVAKTENVLPGGASALVERYDLAQVQAVLLRASRVEVSLTARDPNGLRALFRKLKFLGLIHDIARTPTGVRITIDGPYSLFSQVTKYGLALALAFPALTSAGPYELVADVRWGKERVPLRFGMKSDAGAQKDDVPARLGDDAESLRERFRARESAWKIEAANELLDARGHGIVVPDLVCTHASGTRVFVEVMGFSARDAVFARAELAEKGLLPPIVFCASERLRVSEKVLPDDGHASLLVYKGVIPLGALEEKLAAFLRKR
jgi:predicted nuclease of restriction endonuclease-like RecB superfamily